MERLVYELTICFLRGKKKEIDNSRGVLLITLAVMDA
jgi:hypothetical protein